MPEIHDPEISGLCKQLNDDAEKKEQAWEFLQEYRQQALVAARSSLERDEKEVLIQEARSLLKGKLRALLSRETGDDNGSES